VNLNTVQIVPLTAEEMTRNFEGRREGVEVRMTDELSSRTYLCAQGYGRSQSLAKGRSSADKCLFPAEVPVGYVRHLTTANKCESSTETTTTPTTKMTMMVMSDGN